MQNKNEIKFSLRGERRAKGSLPKGRPPKKKSKLRDIGPKGREGSDKNQFFSLIRKRENYLRGGGVKSKSPFLFGNSIGKF